MSSGSVMTAGENLATLLARVQLTGAAAVLPA